MAKLIDPDSLNQGTEVVINTTAKTIQLLVAGNLNNTSPGSTSGAILQAIYSFLKEEWKTDTALNKFKFPLKMFTKTDGILINGWAWADATTRNLIRDAGWEEVNGDKYAGIISLGNFDSTADQSYYQRVTGYTQAVTNFNKTGNLNEAILITGATGYLKNYLRIQGKLYAEYDLPTEQGFSLLEPVLYKLPLANSTDLKIVATDLAIDTTTPYVGTAELTNTDGSVTAGSPTLTSTTGGFVAGDVGKLITIATGANAGQYKIITFTSGTSVNVDRNFGTTQATITFIKRPKGMKVNFLKGKKFSTWATGVVYVADDVVKDVTGRWFFTVAGGTSNNTSRATDTGVTWIPYDGEVLMGSVYYAFNRLVTANGGTDRQVYDWMQRQLRVTGSGNTGGVLDINQNDNPTASQGLGTAIRGNVAELLAEYVGDTLKTKGGVRLAGFDTNSTNSLVFRDITVDGGGVNANTRLPVTTTERTFPFVAAGNLNFSANLVNEVDADTKYTVYFTTNPGGNFDSSTAIIVNNNAGTPLTGTITAASIPFDFDYTNNVQGGRTANTDAGITIVAQGLSLATWILATHTITKTTGQSVAINADDERNYSNPV